MAEATSGGAIGRGRSTNRRGRPCEKVADRTPRSKAPIPKASHHAGDGLLKTRETNRKKLADTEKRDAAD